MTKSEEIVAILKSIRPEFDFDNVENFFDEGMLDSFDVVNLVAVLEEKYHIKIAGTFILPENFSNVTAIAALLGRCGAAQ